MSRRYLLDELYLKQPPDVQRAITKLETYGLVWATHFGYENAVETLRGIERAFDMGVLYEYLRNRHGVGAGE